MVTGADGQTQWLKVASGPFEGDYVWGRNLSEKPRPVITPSASPTEIVVTAADIHPEPDDATPVLQSLIAGQRVAVVGATPDGWVEIDLERGGVGYVHAQAFQVASAPTLETPALPVPGAIPAPAPQMNGTADPGNNVVPAPSMVSLACVFSAQDSANAVAGVGPLSFTWDEGRACVNGRTAYERISGGFERILLIDKEQRAAVVQMSQDHHTFVRFDYFLDSADYSTLRNAAGDILINITCPSPTETPSQVQAQLTQARQTAEQHLNIPWTRRMTWRCGQVGGV